MLNIDKCYKKALNKFTFVDLFAGIGGFRYAMESFGAKCIFSSVWDKAAQETYKSNFGETPEGDMTKISEKDIPPHNFLCAGFPCQAFSIGGHRRGFEDARGTLFFEIAKIARYHRPDVLLLENVKNLKTHDDGNTLSTILKVLKEINYDTYFKVINSSLFGVPQRRERIYFVAFKSELKATKFNFPKSAGKPTVLKDYIDFALNDLFVERDDIYFHKKDNPEPDQFGQYPQRPIQIGKINKGGQGERIYSCYGHAVTQAATTGGPGGCTGLYYINKKIRKLSPKESSLIMGFPDYFTPHPRRTQAWKQIGNSVVINVLQAIIKEIIDEGILDGCK